MRVYPGWCRVVGIQGGIYPGIPPWYIGRHTTLPTRIYTTMGGIPPYPPGYTPPWEAYHPIHLGIHHLRVYYAHSASLGVQQWCICLPCYPGTVLRVYVPPMLPGYRPKEEMRRKEAFLLWEK